MLNPQRRKNNRETSEKAGDCVNMGLHLTTNAKLDLQPYAMGTDVKEKEISWTILCESFCVEHTIDTELPRRAVAYKVGSQE